LADTLLRGMTDMRYSARLTTQASPEVEFIESGRAQLAAFLLFG
jgi:hypothetical protein